MNKGLEEVRKRAKEEYEKAAMMYQKTSKDERCIDSQAFYQGKARGIETVLWIIDEVMAKSWVEGNV